MRAHEIVVAPMGLLAQQGDKPSVADTRIAKGRDPLR
jgi:hypothetical protein